MPVQLRARARARPPLPCRAGAALIGALFGAFTGPAGAVAILDSSADVFIRDVTGATTSASDTLLSPAAVIPRFGATTSAGSATASSSTSALSDPVTSTMRLYAQGTDSGVSTTLDVEAAFTKSILVDSSTLAAGTPVQIRFDFKLDGRSTVITNSLGLRSLGSVEAFADWKLTDPLQQVCDEGCRDLRIASFGYRSKLLVDTLFNERTWEDRWAAESNATTQLGSETSLVGVSSASTRIAPFSLFVDTFVGRTLDIRASMEVFAQMNLPSSVLGSFRDTFDVDALPVTEGVVIVGEQVGLTTLGDGAPPIPEPGTWALMLAGLAALAGIRARRG